MGMSTKLYNGLKADVSSMAEFVILKKHIQELVERFYVGKFEELVTNVYKCYIKAILKEKHASEEIFIDALGNGLGFLLSEEREVFSHFGKDFESSLNFAESILDRCEIEKDTVIYYKAMILIAITEVLSRVIVQKGMGRLAMRDESSRLKDLDTTVFLYPMEDKCLLYPSDARYKKDGKTHYLQDELLKLPQIEDYHYQNNSDMPGDVTEEQWEKRIEDWDIALEVDRNPLGFLSFGMKIEADNFSAMPIKSFMFCDDASELEEMIEHYLKDVDDKSIIRGIKDDWIFYEEFILPKSLESKLNKSFKMFYDFRDNIQEYRKKYQHFDQYLENLL